MGKHTRDTDNTLENVITLDTDNELRDTKTERQVDNDSPKDTSINVKDTSISEKDTSGVVTEVLGDAPHRKVKGLILRVGPPSFSPVLQRMRKETGSTERERLDTRGRAAVTSLARASHRGRISPHRGASTQGFVLTRTWRRRTRA